MSRTSDMAQMSDPVVVVRGLGELPFAGTPWTLPPPLRPQAALVVVFKSPLWEPEPLSGGSRVQRYSTKVRHGGTAQ